MKVKEVEKLKKELDFLRSHLGDDYLVKIERKLGSLKSEIVVAVENWIGLGSEQGGEILATDSSDNQP